ncbi:metallophosphoesterase family protein [Geoglobus ahangari]|uniref:metallophosphoesterase family protein n=1 Tax=Geoglobus ahangari TaxID=113653 RepID=UPI00064F15C8|nr:metallophosphoesterase [Geoglobus ahangari]
MRIIVSSDLHSRFSMLEKLVDKARADVLAICGDVTDFSRRDVERFLEIVERFSGTCLVVHGNCDYEDAFSSLKSENVEYIHGRSVELDGITFHGLGGSTFTPFNTPSEYDERYYHRLLSRFEYGEKNVLVSHSPPYGVLDVTHSGVNAGSVAIRENAHLFDFILCGHIHEARGVERVGSTVVVNPGTLSRGEYGELTTGSSVTLLKL